MNTLCEKMNIVFGIVLLNQIKSNLFTNSRK